MFLYELALELEEKSVDLAARAQQMGIPGALPNTELTNAQALALRGQGPMPAGTEGTAAGPAPLPWGASPPAAPAAGAPAASAPPTAPTVARLGRSATNQISAEMERLRPRRRISARLAPSLLLVAIVVGVAGLLAYMTANMGSLEDKKAELAASTARAEAETQAAAAENVARASVGANAPVVGAKAPTTGQVDAGVADAAAFCTSAAMAGSWMADVAGRAAVGELGAGGGILPQMLRDRPLELDGALETLADATSGGLHDDAIRLSAVFRSIRDGVLGAPDPGEVEASAAAGLRQLQSPELQAAVARVVAVRASSCS
jgi:hypothetical protein